MLHNAISQDNNFFKWIIGKAFDVSGFCSVLFVFVFLFSDNSLPFITDAFILVVSLEVLLLCSVIDILKSISFGSNDVLLSFNSGDFSLLAILSS